MCMNSNSLLLLHPPSERRPEFVALWTGKDIPAGLPHELEVVASWPSICGSWMSLFVFVGQMDMITYRHLPPLLNL
jgi:hypothetical protein